MTAAAQADRLAESLVRIDTAMSAAEAQVAAGGRVDLAGLEVQIAQICGTLPDLAPGDRHRLLAPLGGLIDRCDALAAALTAALELARKTTGPSPQQVARAYGGSGGGSAGTATSGGSGGGSGSGSGSGNDAPR
ncbi:MAG: hypothetical protein H6843_08210 [Rhodospirillaceae bacterium]|nr:hypothetical protein [Rhodospirillaceae bacterium]